MNKIYHVRAKSFRSFVTSGTVTVLKGFTVKEENMSLPLLSLILALDSAYLWMKVSKDTINSKAPFPRTENFPKISLLKVDNFKFFFTICIGK